MDRLNSDELLRQTLINVFNLPEETVSSFIDQLTTDGSIALVDQRISTLPPEVLQGIQDAAGYTANDTSSDNIELGDDSLDGTVDFYDQHMYKSPEENEEDVGAYDSVKSLLSRLSGKCGCGGSLREFMDSTLHEMNDIDAEQTITNDTNDGMDPSTMRRIQALRDAGNDQAADNLVKQAARRKMVTRNTRPKSPLDNMIKSQKRQLALSIQRRNAATMQSNDPQQ